MRNRINNVKAIEATLANRYRDTQQYRVRSATYEIVARGRTWSVVEHSTRNVARSGFATAEAATEYRTRMGLAKHVEESEAAA